MSKKKKGKRERPARIARASARRSPRDIGGAIAAGALVLAIAGAGLAVDSGAGNSFDAPKRLTTLVCTAAAALAAFGVSRWRNPLSGFSFRRLSAPSAAAACVLAAAGLAALSALVSPRRAAALDATRALFLYALLLPLGASRVVERRKTLLLAAFLAVVAVNAGVSFLQARNIYQPLQLVTIGSREATGAFAGNPGSLAIALALSAVACLGVALFGRAVALRAVAAAGAAVFGSSLLVNRNLTSITALLSGVALLLAARFGRRAVLPIALILLFLGLVTLAYPPMRWRAREAAFAVRTRNWDALVTYRLGAWAAALEMVRDRPWTGFGPGTYGAEFVSHRLRAEIQARRRMGNPLATSSYAEAHNDYLQLFAEAGVPAGLLLLAAATLLFGRLGLTARRPEASPRRAETLFLLAFLGAGAVAALTWFPFQRPISSLPLLLAAGRAWRISAPEPGTGEASAPE
jgi:O-antigen ligase